MVNKKDEGNQAVAEEGGRQTRSPCEVKRRSKRTAEYITKRRKNKEMKQKNVSFLLSLKPGRQSGAHTSPFLTGGGGTKYT